MKALIFKRIFVVTFLMTLSMGLFSQSVISGKWEGLFMENFKTIIRINTLDSSDLTGNIQLFSTGEMIQNDQLSNIQITKNRFTFFIPAKDTRFQGILNNEDSSIEGIFIFPDKSEHPVTLTRKLESITRTSDSLKTLANPENILLSVNDQLEDINFLLENLKENHPRMYAYTSENEFNSSISSLLKGLKPDENIFAFYTLVATVADKVKCSHTGVQLPASIKNQRQETGNYFPLRLLFSEDKAYCVENAAQNSEIKPGDEIRSINDQSIQSIKEQLFLFFPAEGNNLSTKEYHIIRDFIITFNLIDNSLQFRVEYAGKNGKSYETVNACPYAQLARTEKCGVYPFRFEFNKADKTGYLTMYSFSFNDITKYIQQMDQVFLELQQNKAQNLVLDLRGNSGGHPIFAAQLFSYLSQKEFVWFNRNDEIKDFEPLYNTMKANKINFNGKLYVLTNGGCLSTTGHLISHLNTLENAIFVGQEPGSTGLCNDYSLKIKLPQSEIEVNIPRTTFVTATEKQTCFRMDYLVSQSPSDFVKGTDTVVEFVNKLIRSDL